jgi:hypothetical protein
MKRIKQILSSMLVLTILVTGVIYPVTSSVEAQAQSIAPQVLNPEQELIVVEATEDGNRVKAIYDKKTQQIQLISDNGEEQHTYDVELLDIVDEHNAKLMVTDENGESMLMGFGTFESNKRVKRAIPILLAAIAGTIGRQAVLNLLKALFAAGIIVYVGDQAFVVVTEIAQSLRKKREYDHYEARIMNDDVYIGKGLTFEQAVVHLRTTGHDGGVWSVSYDKAEKVARDAGGGKDPEGPEIHRNKKTGSFKGRYPHFHAKGHKGGHSWY